MLPADAQKTRRSPAESWDDERVTRVRQELSNLALPDT